MADMHTSGEYKLQLWELIPRGLAWTRKKDSNTDKVLAGEAEELARIDARAINLVLNEFYAQSTRELLAEWELEYGLPDKCRALGATYEERIQDLLQKIRTIGGQSKEYYITLMRGLGIEITIDEYDVFRAGRNVCGDRLYSKDWLYVWKVNCMSDRQYVFRTDKNVCGDRLRWWKSNAIVECIINQLKPAHTYVIFGYYFS